MAGSIPDVHAVQLIPLDSEGRPRMKDGAKMPKRTLGASGGCCAVVGNPAPNSDGLDSRRGPRGRLGPQPRGVNKRLW